MRHWLSKLLLKKKEVCDITLADANPVKNKTKYDALSDDV